MRRSALAVVGALVLALAGCGSEPAGEPVTAPTVPGIPVPGDGAASAGTAEVHCSGDPEAAADARVEIAFVAVVRTAERLDDGSDWVTFDVDQWFTDDLGTEIALFARDWDGAPGERWLVAGSRYDVHGRASGDVFPCESDPYSVTELAEWELVYGPPVDAGAGVPEQPADAAVLAAIDDAEARWQAADLRSYTYAVSVHDRADWITAPDDRCGLGMIRVVVEAGEAVQARDLSHHCDVPVGDAPAIADLFEQVRSTAGAVGPGAITEPTEGDDAVGVVPTFDPELGYPRAWTAADRSVERSIWFDEFLTRAVPLDPGEPATVVAEAMARWRAAGIDSYEAVVDVRCFCDVDGPFDVTVVDGEITSDVPVGLDWIVPTVDGFFEHVEAARLPDDAPELAFDPELGYPVALRFEGDLDAVDDELQLFVHDLRPLP